VTFDLTPVTSTPYDLMTVAAGSSPVPGRRGHRHSMMWWLAVSGVSHRVVSCAAPVPDRACARNIAI
jgi:hypothetical protein